ncbi:MAG: hypothetical protein Q4G59_13485 [Planctomycetia bacterium]|nr:hypothetical protein [Planctomycetia bacterium]
MDVTFNVTPKANDDIEAYDENGLQSRSDGVKDWLYRGGGKTHGFFTDRLDYAQALNNRVYNDEVFMVDFE